MYVYELNHEFMKEQYGDDHATLFEMINPDSDSHASGKIKCHAPPQQATPTPYIDRTTAYRINSLTRSVVYSLDNCV